LRRDLQRFLQAGQPLGAALLHELLHAGRVVPFHPLLPAGTAWGRARRRLGDSRQAEAGQHNGGEQLLGRMFHDFLPLGDQWARVGFKLWAGSEFGRRVYRRHASAVAIV
jgi:hypothetical protein